MASAEALPSFAEPFDEVMASNVLLFLANPVETLRQRRTLMRPGGMIAITHQSRKQGATDADTTRDAERIATQLRDAGFSGVRIETLIMRPVNAACVLGRA